MRLNGVIVGTCLALSVSVSAKPTNTVEGFKTQLDKVAEEIGVESDKYLHAAQIYQKLNSGALERKYKQLNEMESIIEYQWYLNSGQTAPPELKARYLEERNLQQMHYANQLGLDVTKLDNFFEVHNKLSGTGKFVGLDSPSALNTEINNEFSTLNVSTEYERILIRCDADCASGGKSSGIPFSLAIAIKASQAGIPDSIRYVRANPFPVEFQNSSGDTVKMESWMHNSFSGAWKDSNLPCSKCRVTKPQ